jgi:hypothetical protein
MSRTEDSDGEEEEYLQKGANPESNSFTEIENNQHKFQIRR